MHDIKYFFSIKLIKQSREGKKFPGNKLPNYRKALFLKKLDDAAAPRTLWIRR
jgi:hypothetical protein